MKIIYGSYTLFFFFKKLKETFEPFICPQNLETLKDTADGRPHLIFPG